MDRNLCTEHYEIVEVFWVNWVTSENLRNDLNLICDFVKRLDMEYVKNGRFCIAEDERFDWTKRFVCHQELVRLMKEEEKVIELEKGKILKAKTCNNVSSIQPKLILRRTKRRKSTMILTRQRTATFQTSK